MFKKSIKGDKNRILIVAEIGKNFIQTKKSQSIKQYLENAKQLISLARDAGADAVKFQTHNVEDEQMNIAISSPHFSGQDRYNWVKRNTDCTPLYFWKEIKKFCDQIGIIFFTTPMSRGAAIKLEELNLPLWKVGSGDLLDFVLLDYLASTGKPIILSTGMSTLKEVELAVDFLRSRIKDIYLLYCVSKYPAEANDFNFKTINYLNKLFGLGVGFSDHSLSYDTVLAAIKCGAVIIEKHFSLSRDLWGADHKVSLTPGEFKIMVEKIRKGNETKIKNFGCFSKILDSNEKKFRPIFRKSLVAGMDIPAGTVLTKDMIYAMRPQKYLAGMPSQNYDEALDHVVRQDLKKFDPISRDILARSKNKRKICVVITSAIHYSRSKKILETLASRSDIILQIVVAASALLDKYGNILNLLKNDGITCDAKVIMSVEGGSPVSMAKTAGLGILEFSNIFDNLSPDIVLVRGDRYEVLSAVIAAAYLNISVAHIEGGDLSGNIDESVRHAITKLSHFHFVTNEQAYKRVINMGEDPHCVFNIGAPELEMINSNCLPLSVDEIINNIGVGADISMNGKYIIVMQHPVTSEFGNNYYNIEKTLKAVYDLDIAAVWFWPNIDAGTDEVSKALRIFREKHNNYKIRFIKYLPPDIFLRLLQYSVCLVGNSSSGIKECSFLGVPVVNIGSRQNGRQRAGNVVDVGYDASEIKRAIKQQIKHGSYEPSLLYYKENVSANIADILAKAKIYSQKKFYDKENV